jgi:cytochrome c
MPFNEPGSLNNSQVYAAAAYILYLNEIVGQNEVLNAKTLPKIRMPNRDGFVPDSRPDVKRK